jgi:hypothetical protein
MSNLTAGRGSLISQHLRAAEKILGEVVFDVNHVWSVKACRAEGLGFKFVRSR